MLQNLTRYRTGAADSARWTGFPFRQGDIVISTRPKCGTTWMQMITALLIFQTPELPGELLHVSPWLDWLVIPHDKLLQRLDAQRHRRFIKTHTPLDGLPLDERATYIVVGRHPLDATVSRYYQRINIDRSRTRQLIGQPGREQPLPASVRDWLLQWIEADPDPSEDINSLPGVMWHLSGAWERRHEPNVVLVHYDDLTADLEGEMRLLACLLGISIPGERWPALVHAATFEQMRAGAERLGPRPGTLKDAAAFFRRGCSGAARELLAEEDLDRYRARTERLAPPGLLSWLHRDMA